MKSVVHFGDEKIKQSFEELKNSKEKLLYKWVNRAIDDLGENAFCGTQIPKRLWPKDYIQKYSINNLWKYDLPSGLRLIYFISKDEVNIISIILEWFDHKNYERRFKY